MTTSDLYNGLRQLLTGSGGASLIKRMSARHMPWDEFISQPLPPEMSPLATWDLLKLLARASGVEFPIPDIDGNEYWYLRTHEIADSVARIQCMCRADSDLYRTLTMTQNRSVLVQSRIDETIAAAWLDGLQISEKEARGLLELDRAPRNDTERLVRNTLTVLDDLQTLIDVPFSKELVWHLRYLLLEGVDVREIKSTEPRMGLMTLEYGQEQVAEAADRQLEYITAYMNHATGDPHDHPVLRALLIPDLFRFYRPLPDVNSEVGRLAFRLYALKTGLPVLGMLPLSRAKLNWEDGTLNSSVISLAHDPFFEARRHDGTDLTAYTTLSVQLTLVALQDLSWDLVKLERRDAELRELLQQDPLINHRQRSILGRALRDPTAEFRIAYHKNTHNVVYATARADLLELVEKGYLTMAKSGRAHVFVPREDLREYIESQYGAG